MIGTTRVNPGINGLDEKATIQWYKDIQCKESFFYAISCVAHQAKLPPFVVLNGKEVDYISLGGHVM